MPQPLVGAPPVAPDEEEEAAWVVAPPPDVLPVLPPLALAALWPPEPAEALTAAVPPHAERTTPNEPTPTARTYLMREG